MDTPDGTVLRALAAMLAAEGRSAEAAALARLLLGIARPDRAPAPSISQAASRADMEFLLGLSRGGERPPPGGSRLKAAERLLDLAAEAASAAARERHDDPAPCRRAAVLWMEAGQPAKAVPWFRRAIERATERAKAGGIGHGDPDAGALETGALEDGLAKAVAARNGALPGPVPSGLEEEPLLLDTLLRIPLFQGRGLAGLAWKPLTAGRMNKTYRITLDGTRYALRLGKFPGSPRTPHHQHHFNLKIACALSLAPDLLFLDENDGAMLTPFLGGQKHAGQIGPDCLEQVGALLARLHRWKTPFRGRHDLFGEVRYFEDRIDGQTFGPTPDLDEIRRQCAPVAAALAAGRDRLVPCHNDVRAENLLDSADGPVLIDWELSAMADPDWELGAFCVKAMLDGDGENALFSAYYGDAGHPRASRARLYGILLRYLYVIQALPVCLTPDASRTWHRHLDLHLDHLRNRLFGPDLDVLLRRAGAARASQEIR